MSSPREWALLACAILACRSVDATAAPVQPELSGYAVLGVAGARLGSAVRVQSGSVGSVAGELRLAAHVSVAGSAAADVVRVGVGVKVDPVFCRLIVGAAFGRGVVGGPSVRGATVPACEPLVTPVVDGRSQDKPANGNVTT